MEFTEFSYLDATPYDTPILDRDTREKIQEKIDSYFIDDRLERAIIFRTFGWQNADRNVDQGYVIERKFVKLALHAYVLKRTVTVRLC